MNGLSVGLVRLSLLLVLGSTQPAQGAGAPSRGTLYLSALGGTLYRSSYVYDGDALFTVSPPTAVALLRRGGSVRVLPDGRVVVVGAGYVSVYDPLRHTVALVNSLTNANTATLDPSGAKLWVGWKDTPLSEVPLSPLANGTAHAVSGDDTIATMLAFAPGQGAFYATGGEFENGNFGRINLATFSTTRVAAAAYATGVVYDSYSRTLITAGLGRARQVAPSNPATLLSARDDSGAGENYLILEPTGQGQLIGTRTGGEARVVLLDFSASGRIGEATSTLHSTVLNTITDLSGGAGWDGDLVFSDTFEPPAVSP